MQTFGELLLFGGLFAKGKQNTAREKNGTKKSNFNENTYHFQQQQQQQSTNQLNAFIDIYDH